MRRLARYSTLINEASLAHLDESAAEVRISITIPGHALGCGRHANEYYLALLIVGGQTLTDGPFTLSRVWFSHPAPPNTQRHRSLLGTSKLEFDAPDCGFAIPTAVADAPLRSADPALMSAIDEQAELLLRHRNAEPDLLDTVRSWLARSLHEGLVTLEDVAREVAMAPRTLQRRLRERGTSFRELLDDVRRQLFDGLRKRGMPLQDVASRLGYAAMGSFRRAQRRWER